MVQAVIEPLMERLGFAKADDANEVPMGRNQKEVHRFARAGSAPHEGGRNVGCARLFRQKVGFRLVRIAEKDKLLPMYWGVSPRQIEASVVLADEPWTARTEGPEPTR